MNGTISRFAPPLAFACLVLAGCGQDEDARVEDGTRAAADSVSADSVFVPAENVVTLPSSSIYYTLTSYDWYARGEPLVHEGRPYEPEGMPVTASLDAMSKAGEYQGVDYYVQNNDVDAVVYVPVYDGYWQRFRADPSSVAMPQDAGTDAGSAPPDSTTARP